MYSLQRRYGHHFRKKGLAEMEFPDSSFFFDGCVSDCFSTVALKQFFSLQFDGFCRDFFTEPAIVFYKQHRGLVFFQQRFNLHSGEYVDKI